MNDLALYNEIDDFAADWLENLIRAGHIAPGRVDRRSILDLTPDDIAGYRQVHFFAGIGIWSAALRDAGVQDDEPVWTGSCPCQPFSAAGKGNGFADERHLWPAFHWLIEQCRPAIVLGEQVASPDGLRWLDLVQDDMEGTGYAFGAVDICAAGACVDFAETGEGQATIEWIRGAILSCPDPFLAAELRDFAEWARANLGSGPAHIRQRLYWVADADGRDAGTEGLQRGGQQRQQPQDGSAGARSGAAGELAHGESDGRREERPDAGRLDARDRAQGLPAGFEPSRDASELGDTDDARPQRRRLDRDGSDQLVTRSPGLARPTDWIVCTDGKARPVESGTQPLAHGAPARVGRLRAYGNAINKAQAVQFIEAVWD